MSLTKVFFLTNNKQSLDLFDWIKMQTETECKLFQDRINSKLLDDFLPDLIISYGYRFIIKEDVIKKYPNKIINLHISYLPWNKGADPNIWSYLEETPKGVTIHLIDQGIDTGDIIFQKEIKIDEDNETLSSSYTKLQNEIKNLFKDNWNIIKNLEFNPIKQKGEGSIHYIKDLKEISFLLEKKGWETPIMELKKKYKEYLNRNENT